MTPNEFKLIKRRVLHGVNGVGIGSFGVTALPSIPPYLRAEFSSIKLIDKTADWYPT